MTVPFNNFFKKHPRRIFIVDGIGAIVSAICLGLILPFFQDSFGMPPGILYLLALVAVVFAVYSFTCYKFISGNRRPFLKLIILANVLYCGLTIVMMLYFFKQLTTWDLIYFILESVVIIVLINLEYWVLTRFFKEIH
jgi:hypothetical protein